MSPATAPLAACALLIPLSTAVWGQGQAVRARYVRVESGASTSYLHFAELEVYVKGRNIAAGKPATASSTMPPFTPDRAVDGIIGYAWGPDASFWSSAGAKGGEWWEVDLGEEVAIDRLVLYNRLDAVPERLEGAVLVALAADRREVYRRQLGGNTVPIESVFVEREDPPVDLSAESLAERRSELSPVFSAPSDDAGYVMPVGSGDLSAMLRYADAWEVHLSKTDSFGPGSILSPGHVQLDFGLSNDQITDFEQRLDLNRGSVSLAIKTPEGGITAECWGVRGANVLVVDVRDTRPAPQANVTFSIWRPGMDLSVADGVLLAREVHDCDESGGRVVDPARVSPQDRVYGLEVATALAVGGDAGLLQATGETREAAGIKTVALRPTVEGSYRVLIACATSYDGKAQAAARGALDSLLASDLSWVRSEHLAWWDEFWTASFVDLYGRDADRLTQLWHVTLYSYASVGEGPVLPKFNGGPGLVHEDDRCWGWGYWWQNTRELIWPMYAANHLRYAQDHLGFYDRAFMHYKRRTADQGKLGIRVWEDALPARPGSVTAGKVVSSFDPQALAAAQADRRMQSVPSGYNARSMAQGAELVQLLFDWVAFTGDAGYLRTVVAPWLKEVVLFYLSFLKLEDDGLYHMTPSDALEMWWEVRDPMTDMCAVRYCFWQALNHGADFGYEPEFLQAIRERLDRLAPLPTGHIKRRAAREGEVPAGRPDYVGQAADLEPADDQYAPMAAFLADPCIYNMEQPELYVIFPFGLVDATAPDADYQRALKAFRARQNPNSAGWSQCGIQAARLRLPDTVDVIMDHVRRHQLYPYGGWVNVAAPLKGSKLGLSDVPYFDAAGVNVTALQESLLQSHVRTSPERTDPLSGGPICILPAVRDDWAGRFRLRARGGFLVNVEFQARRKPTVIRIESERGQTLRLENPFVECRVLRDGEQVAVSTHPVVIVPTRPGELLEFVGDAMRNH